tara:strand:- start:3908 stop:4147 length:240 start_codon:yes stop_codon:yes gene_type:complete
MTDSIADSQTRCYYRWFCQCQAEYGEYMLKRQMAQKVLSKMHWTHSQYTYWKNQFEDCEFILCLLKEDIDIAKENINLY